MNKNRCMCTFFILICFWTQKYTSLYPAYYPYKYKLINYILYVLKNNNVIKMNCIYQISYNRLGLFNQYNSNLQYGDAISYCLVIVCHLDQPLFCDKRHNSFYLILRLFTIWLNRFMFMLNLPCRHIICMCYILLLIMYNLIYRYIYRISIMFFFFIMDIT